MCLSMTVALDLLLTSNFTLGPQGGFEDHLCDRQVQDKAANGMKRLLMISLGFAFIIFEDII